MPILMENDEIIYVELRCESAFSVSYMAESLKFRENLPNSQKFRGPTQSGLSQGSQR